MSAKGPERALPTPRTDWETPWPLFNLLDREFRFTLDAAASTENRKCERYLTEAEDALDADIFDQTVFVNPPYGKGLSDWVARFGLWSVNGCTVVALLPANTDTTWFRLLWFWSHEVRILSGRVQFVGGGNSNTGGSMVAVIRPNVFTIAAAIPGKPAELFVERVDPPRVVLWDWRLDL